MRRGRGRTPHCPSVRPPGRPSVRVHGWRLSLNDLSTILLVYREVCARTSTYSVYAFISVQRPPWTRVWGTIAYKSMKRPAFRCFMISNPAHPPSYSILPFIFWPFALKIESRWTRTILGGSPAPEELLLRQLWVGAKPWTITAKRPGEECRNVDRSIPSFMAAKLKDEMEGHEEAED